MFDSISNGWPLVLSSLKSYLEAGRVLYAPWYEPTSRQEDGGAARGGPRMTDTGKPKFVYVTYIRTTAEKLWRALIEPEFTRQYWAETRRSATGRPARRGGS